MQGLSFIEIMVTLSVIALGLLIAVPNYQRFLANNRQTTNVNRLIGALHFARQQGILKRISISLCPARKDGVLGCGTDWSQGVIIYRRNKQQPLLVSSQQLLRIIEPFASTQVTWNHAKPVITFHRNGALSGLPGRFRLQSNEKKALEIKTVILSKTGRIRRG